MALVIVFIFVNDGFLVHPIKMRISFVLFIGDTAFVHNYLYSSLPFGSLLIHSHYFRYFGKIFILVQGIPAYLCC
jgi:hypothetical protein